MKTNTLRISIFVAFALLGWVPVSLQAQVGVWPGDADNNGIVNAKDLLYLARAYGLQGPIRTGASIVFTEQQTTAWNDVLPDSAHTNIAHADGDGNGFVDADDSLAIVNNYGRTHGPLHSENMVEGTDMNPPLYFATDYGDIASGSALELHVTLGAPSIPVDSFFGIAFSWNYDTLLVKKNSVHAELDTRWIANATGLSMDQLLFLQRNVPDSGRIDVAISQRYNSGGALARNISGYGNIARISLVIEDNLIGKTDAVHNIGIGPASIKMVDVNLNTYAIKAVSDSLTITTFTGIDGVATNDIKLYPNPATDHMIIAMGNRVAKEIALCDLTGRNLIQLFPEKTGDIILNVSDVASGLYLVKIVTDKGTMTKKIWIK